MTLSSIAEKYYTHLQNHPQNPEKTLDKFNATINVKLDAPCVIEVLKRFSSDKPQMGLRFFIWAGLQNKCYRHGQYVYSMACDVLQICQNLGIIREVVEAYRAEGCVINVKLCKVVLELCKEGRFYDEALWVLRKMEQVNCKPGSTMYNVVIEMFCEKGDLDVAMRLLKEMQSHDLSPHIVTYMSMLKGFCSVGRLEDACLLFKEMNANGCAVNLVAYSALLDGLCRFGHFERALELLGEMEKQGGDCAPNVITYTSVIHSLCEKGKSIEALSILDRMGSFKCYPNRITVSVLVKGLCDEKRVDEAYKLVRKIGGEGPVSSRECYNSLVIGLLGIKRLQDAEKLFTWMLNNNLRPDGLACSILMRKMCATSRFLDAFHLFEDVEKKGFKVTIDSDIYSVLLAGLCQQMNMVEAGKLSNIMIEKRIQIKNAYIEDMKKYFEGSQGMKSLAQLCKIEAEH